MKTKFLPILAIILFLVSACADSTLNGPVTLAPGQSVEGADGTTITVVEVLEDSRCPADALCIRQGNVKVLIEVSFGTETQQYRLTLGELLAGDVTSVMVAGGHMVTLTQVDPYPLTSQPTDPADHRVTLDIQAQ